MQADRIVLTHFSSRYRFLPERCVRSSTPARDHITSSTLPKTITALETRRICSAYDRLQIPFGTPLLLWPSVVTGVEYSSTQIGEQIDRDPPENSEE